MYHSSLLSTDLQLQVPAGDLSLEGGEILSADLTPGLDTPDMFDLRTGLDDSVGCHERETGGVGELE